MVAALAPAPPLHLPASATFSRCLRTQARLAAPCLRPQPLQRSAPDACALSSGEHSQKPPGRGCWGEPGLAPGPRTPPRVSSLRLPASWAAGHGLRGVGLHFPGSTACRAPLHFRLFARCGGLARGEGCVCERAWLGCCGAGEPKAGLESGRRILDPAAHLRSRAQRRKEWLLHIQKQSPSSAFSRPCASLR